MKKLKHGEAVQIEWTDSVRCYQDWTDVSTIAIGWKATFHVSIGYVAKDHKKFVLIMQNASATVFKTGNGMVEGGMVIPKSAIRKITRVYAKADKA